MRILGVELLGGEVLPSNVVEGEKLLRKSAEKDNNSAMTQLGAFLFNGTVIKQNLQEALTWLNKAIVNDDSDAKRVLGAELISGKIIGKDVKRGEELLRNAIQDGNVEAKRAFGKIIIDDQDFKDNFDEGVRLIREAAEEDNREAMSLLANLLFDGKQISQNAREAKQWMKKLIQLGDAYAMENLARRYLYGDGVEKDIREAEKLIARAVEKGNGSAASLLGLFYYENNRLDVAAEYFRTGIKLNSENAKNNFSFMLRRGEVSNYDGTPKIDDLLFQLIEDKDLYSMINYALCFAGGIQRQKDWFKADEIFSQLSNVKEPVKEALMWWHKFLLPKRNDPEGHLVVGWLVRHRFIEDPDNMTVLQRMAKAREGGWDVPDWMDGVVMKNTTKKDGN
jgi:TPR repeat protein